MPKLIYFNAMEFTLPDQTPLCALLVAGGSGSRMQAQLPKQFLPLNGKPVLMHTLEAFSAVSSTIQLILVLPAKDIDFWQKLCAKHRFTRVHTVVTGGDSRFQSVRNGLAHAPEQALVAIHDGVRPLIDPETIERAYLAAHEKGSGVVAVKLKDSLRRLQPESGSQSAHREDYRLVQTPQVFRAAEIHRAYQLPEQDGFTDCASVAEAAGLPIHLVEGSYQNLKITTPEDMLLAEVLLQKRTTAHH